MKKNNVKTLVMTGVMAALCFLGTFIIQMPVPFTNGYIHLGDSMVLISAVILGRNKGAMAAGLGSMLADFAGGWYMWMVPTLLIKAAMAWLLGLILEKAADRKALSAIGAAYAAIWAAFSLLMSFFLRTQVTGESAASLLSEVEGFASAAELMERAGTVGIQLFAAAALLPLLILLFLYAASRIAKVQLPFVSLMGYVVSGSAMIVGYYFAAFALYGNYIAPIFSVPANMLQFAMGAVIATLLTPVALMIRKKLLA